MKRTKHNLSNYKLLSTRMGELVPIGLHEVLPGDSFQHATSALVRCAPLLAPIMHPVHVRIHHWFVPTRLIWKDFEDFITGGPDGNNISEPPYITASGSGVAVGSLADYMGIPTGVPNLAFSALPFRAYNFIYNEWYRDQDLSPEVAWGKDSGPDTFTHWNLQNCAWEKDYFTSARPWEQKGPAVTVPLGMSAPVRKNGYSAAKDIIVRNAETGAPVTSAPLAASATGQLNAAGIPLALDFQNAGLVADLQAASSVNINELRKAMAIQRYEEARARYGSRYVEYLRYLGVKSSDARLDRPEYLGGGSQTIQFSEVLQTAEGSSTDGVGSMYGHGIGAMKSNRYRRFFDEHGYVITLMSVRPKTIYQQGLPRLFSRKYKEDYWQAELQHIGQQEVKNKELYAAHPSPDGTFGYQDRYDEYRFKESTVAGEFRETILDYWHMARKFGSAPALNNDFVQCVPTERVFAVHSNDTLYVMAKHSIQARRLLCKVGTSHIY